MKRSRLLWFIAIFYFLAIMGSIGLGIKIADNKRTDSVLVLSLSDQVDEKMILERLAASGLRQVISESTEWIYIEDFEGPRSIPLQEFFNVIEPADPRNDGYADHLKQVFISNRSRRFFIPLNTFPLWTGREKTTRLIEKSLSEYKPAVGTLGASDLKSPWLFTGILMFGTLILVLFLFKKKHETILAIPAGLILLNFGFGGIVCLGLLIAMQICIQPIQEDLVSQCHHHNRLSLRVYFHWYKAQILNGVLFISLYLISGYFLKVHWLLALSSLVLHLIAGLLVLILRKQRNVAIDHRLFLPVELLRSSKSLVLPFKVLVPFALGALILFSQSFLLSKDRIGLAKVESQDFLSLEQYEAHLNTQSDFMRQPLHKNDVSQLPYSSYVLGPDGLISQSQQNVFENSYKNLDMPPLESLLFVKQSVPFQQNTIGQGLYLVIFFTGALFLTFRASHGSLLTLYKSGYLDKRIAA